MDSPLMETVNVSPASLGGAIDCTLRNLVIVGIVVLFYYYYFYLPGQPYATMEAYGTAYDQAYIAPYPDSQTTPYSGPQGYGQWFSSGPPNVG
jgi:hypothetical protein